MTRVDLEGRERIAEHHASKIKPDSHETANRPSEPHLSHHVQITTGVSDQGVTCKV